MFSATLELRTVLRLKLLLEYPSNRIRKISSYWVNRDVSIIERHNSAAMRQCPDMFITASVFMGLTHGLTLVLPLLHFRSVTN